MSFELTKQKITLEQLKCQESTQILVEGDIIVPDVKPDMRTLLQLDHKVQIDELDVSSGHVNFSGDLFIDIMYLARNSSKPVHSINASLPIQDIIHMEQVTSQMHITAKAQLNHMDTQLINDRKLHIKAVIKVDVSAYHETEQEFISQAQDPDIQIAHSELQMESSIERIKDQFIVKDEFAVPSGHPNISHILQNNVAIKDKEVRITEGKVSVRGNLSLTTLYVGDTDESILEICQQDIPFNGSLESRFAREGLFYDIDLDVVNKYIQPTPDSDGEDRLLETEITLSAEVCLYAQEEHTIVKDAYCIGKELTLAKNKIAYPKSICINKSQNTFKESLQSPENSPSIMQVYQVSGYPKVDDIALSENKLVVEGCIDATVLYVAKDDENPLYAFDQTIPFQHTIDAIGAKEDMKSTVHTEIDHVNFNLVSETEVEAQFVLNFDAKVKEILSTDFITDMSISDQDPQVLGDIPSMTIYVVQPGDSPWSIAKKFRTSVDELAELNELEDRSKVTPGSKLLILKKITEEA